MTSGNARPQHAFARQQYRDRGVSHLRRHERAWLAALVLSLLATCGCEPELVVREPTQITLRLSAEPGLREQLTSLEVSVATLQSGRWVQSEGGAATLTVTSWPIDLPIVPGAQKPLDGEFEVMVQGYGKGRSEPQVVARVLSRFVPTEQRLLALELSLCGREPYDHCEPDLGCHGPACPTCLVEAQRCGTVPTRPGSSLPPLDPDAPGVVESDASTLQESEDAGSPSECPSAPRCRDGKVERCERGLVVSEACPALCVDGECTGECKPESTRCEEFTPYLCDDEGQWQERAECSHLCRRGKCVVPPSCSPDVDCSNDQSCCISDMVPGGTFERGLASGDTHGVDLGATVSPFLLDRYEVTVARFRRWLHFYLQTPSAGDGKNPNNPMDAGWEAYWTTEELPPTAEELAQRLIDCPGHTFTEVANTQEQMPINCVTWFEAQAFCIWDGGRLPSEAEWNFAAAGGDEQRLYPWVKPNTAVHVDETYAIYGPAMPIEVGSRPKGTARWGQADMAGNLYEWVQDWYEAYYLQGPCSDCAQLESLGKGRVLRGGASGTTQVELRTDARMGYAARERNRSVGFRCARDL